MNPHVFNPRFFYSAYLSNCPFLVINPPQIYTILIEFSIPLIISILDSRLIEIVQYKLHSFYGGSGVIFSIYRTVVLTDRNCAIVHTLLLRVILCFVNIILKILDFFRRCYSYIQKIPNVPRKPEEQKNCFLFLFHPDHQQARLTL